MGLLSAGLSHIGMKRKTNQDSIYINPEANLFIVADGMGGHNGGDIASKLAVEHIPEFILKNLNADPIQVLTEAIQYGNSKIKQVGIENPQLKGMGTTVVGLYFKEDKLYIPNVGDSRAYLVNKNKIYQLTKDHSLVQEKINLGIYTRDQAAKDPQKNILVRTVGFDDEVEVDIMNYKVCKNDILFICSDGLYGKVSDKDMIHIINSHIPDPEQANSDSLKKVAQTLVHQANLNGGNDNISLIMVVAK